MIANKRIHIRKDCLVPVRYTYEGQHKTYYARMVNYGDGGLCLKTRTPIEPGAKLELSLEGYSPRGIRPRRIRPLSRGRLLDQADSRAGAAGLRDRTEVQRVKAGHPAPFAPTPAGRSRGCLRAAG